MHRIYFYANLGDLTKPVYGGGEEGNRRTLDILRSSFDVVVIPKYAKSKGPKIKKAVVTPLKAIANYFQFLATLVPGRRSDSVVHVSGFYGAMVYWEWLLVKTARLLGYKTVYEMRGGGAERFYTHGSHLYKKIFASIIKNCDYLFSQGEENRTLINGIAPGHDFYHYPNYVRPGFQPGECPFKSHDSINLVFFGRLSPSKHIDLICETYSLLSQSTKYRFRLTLIGKFSSDRYALEIKTHYDGIDFIDGCNHEKLRDYLLDKHFYLFPTTEMREGHSNALTEAMAFGIVPVASSNGFNRSVIDDNSLIVTKLDPKAYADIIVKILDSGSYDDYSVRQYDRVTTLFSYATARNRLIEKYQSIFKDK